jgi:predicted nucleic acid-binding protein
MIVADTNLIVYLFVTGDQTTPAQEVLDKDPDWIVPPLWCNEFQNVLAAYICRGLALQQAKQILQNAMQTLETRQVVPSENEILDLIAGKDCTAYDCEFVALAKQLNIYLVTADKQLLREFPDYTISLEEYVK